MQRHLKTALSLDHGRLAEIDAMLARTRSRAAGLHARAEAAVAASRRITGISSDVRVGVRACKAVWEALRQVPPPARTFEVCSICNQVRTPGRGWTSVPAAVLHRMKHYPGGVPMTPATCSPCSAEHPLEPVRPSPPAGRTR